MMSDEMLPLTHVYHLWADGRYEELVGEHIDCMEVCGLLPNLDRWVVGIEGTEENAERAIEFLYSELHPSRHSRLDPVWVGEDGWEQPTLRLAQEKVSLGELVFYAHSKGASKSVREEIRFSQNWRGWMMYHLIGNWSQCVKVLETTGVQLVVPEWFSHTSGESRELYGPGWFSPGNFWWADGGFLSEIPPPLDRSRFNAETWFSDVCETEPAVYEMERKRGRYKASEFNRQKWRYLRGDMPEWVGVGTPPDLKRRIERLNLPS